ncbi:MAG: pyruvate kinase [Proteobacteria bacterium]|nr:pyruvate kinase [Pseudomonadota bacterium]MBU1687595.1 pyruvate kinase [Pseudomonadota bacterium]
MLRRTKIVATLGPATDNPAMLDAIILAGMDVARLNFSHNSRESQIRRAHLVRDRARALDRWIGILMDLQGPKIRITHFRNGKILLAEGDEFTLDPSCPPEDGDQSRVGITYPLLAEDIVPGAVLLLDDGRIVLEAMGVQKGKILCQVRTGGELSNGKGINLQGGGLSVPALTDKDRQDIKTAAELKADYLAVSFPRSAVDINLARKLFVEAGGTGRIVAKIERAEAMANIEEIIEAADVVMIARGDLGVEIGDAALPPAQKKIIKLSRAMNRAVITATQMMESMIVNPIPTRAEVFDVANAVLEGTDAVMLSAETAVGHHPDVVIRAMARICAETENQDSAQTSEHRINTRFNRIDEAISLATMYIANHLGVKAIAALTETGSTPLWMSRISSGIPIYALTEHAAVRRRVTLYRGVYPANFKIKSSDHTVVNKEAVAELLRRGVVENGDLVVITKGDLVGIQGSTNSLKIVRVGELVEPVQGDPT